METYNLKNDLKVFGNKVTTFPLGIGEAFHALINMIPDGSHRAYYGLSHMDEKGKIIYKTAAEENTRARLKNMIASDMLLKKVSAWQ